MLKFKLFLKYNVKKKIPIVSYLKLSYFCNIKGSYIGKRY